MVSSILFWSVLQLFTSTPNNSIINSGLNGPDSTKIAGQFETTPIWADEFDKPGAPDPSKWSYETGGNGFGNNELQFYTPGQNVKVENGVLKITARMEQYENRQFTSGKMITKGKGDWKYGRFEARIKLPSGKGTWPAFWMLSTEGIYGGWPKSGEIDIMEHVGYDLNKIFVTVHTEAFNHIKGTQVGRDTLVKGVAEGFNLYRVDWTPTVITGYVNNSKMFEFKNRNLDYDKWPFDEKFYILLNLAVGGNWGGKEGIDNSSFPNTMEVDYVRVYKLVE